MLKNAPPLFQLFSVLMLFPTLVCKLCICSCLHFILISKSILDKVLKIQNGVVALMSYHSLVDSQYRVQSSRRADETAVQVIKEMLVGNISDSMIGVIICEILPICSNNGPL